MTDDARQGFVDMTQALRSPGSTLKPLVYALAFDQGLAHPETLIEDRPDRFRRLCPQNFDRQFRGTIRVREALQLSLNIPVVALTEAWGPARLMAALRRAGRGRAAGQAAQPGLAVALGGVGVTLEHLVQLYAALAGAAWPCRCAPRATASGRGARWCRRGGLAGGRHPGGPCRRPPGARPTGWPTRPAPAMATAMPGRWA
jgi:penicillin-binding protein 1C